MKDIMKMLGQFQQIQDRMKKAQEELQSLEIEGQAGAGLVKVTLNGKSDMRRVSIDKSLLKPEDVEILEDLIVAAHQDARAKVETTMQAKMQEVAGGLPLPPGLKLF